MAIRIITDSTSDINVDEARKLEISVVPLKVIFGDKEYKEGIEITIESFYEKLVKSEKLPTTSQPSPDDFLVHFNEAKKAEDSVIVLLISGKLSGTVQSAIIAKDMSDYSDIYIIDTLTTITGLRLLVEEAVRLRQQGESAVQIYDILNGLKDRVVLLAMVDTLEYLHKGGRLSKSSAILGSLLNFKPVITLKDGVIGVVGKERGSNKGINKLIDSIEDFGEIDQSFPVNLGFTAEDSKCLLLEEKLIERMKLNNIHRYPVGCVVGTHAGPGASVLTYIKKP
ncbi:MAG TPA: DegV family protein [Mobilitalea sp.]|nr:DegV family protein [Mobilitalea sp.]